MWNLLSSCPNFHNGYVDEKMSLYHLIVAHSESIKIQLRVKYAFNKNVNLRRRRLELSVKSNVARGVVKLRPVKMSYVHRFD